MLQKNKITIFKSPKSQ